MLISSWVSGLSLPAATITGDFAVDLGRGEDVSEHTQLIYKSFAFKLI